MKKQPLLFTAFMAIAMLANAQTSIPNGGFEQWVNVGSSTAQPYLWNSNKSAPSTIPSGGTNYAPSGPQTCFRDTSSLGGGQYSVKIESVEYLGITLVNGSCTTGEVEAPSTSKADGYIWSIAGDTAHSAAFTGRPDSLVFWYRYTPGSGGDTPSVQARLHVGNCYAPEAPSNSNHPDSTVNIIARALWTATGATVASWQRVSIPFVYVDGRTPQYILITMTSSADNVGGVANSTLWVDQMQAIYNAGPPPTATFSDQLSNCGNGVFINTSTNAASFTWSFSQLTGGSFDTTINNVDTVTIPASQTNNGKYLVCITARNSVDTVQTCDTVQFTCTGINEISASDLNIYPNPASKVLNIQASQIISAVSVLDETGRIVAEASDINSLHYQMNTSRLGSGIYFVRISGVQGQVPAVRKVTIE